MDPAEYARIAAAEDEHWWYRHTRALMADMLGPHLTAGQTILDAGCGPGGNGAWMTGHGRVVGVDVSPHAMGFLQAQRPEVIPVLGSITDLPVRSGAVDVAVEVTVLCEVDDDVSGAREMARALKPGGVGFFMEPAFPALRRGHDVVAKVKRRYRMAGLLGLVEGAGLRIERATYAHAYLLPVAAALAVDYRLRKRTPGESVSDLQRPGLDGVFDRGTRLERALLQRRDLPAGVSAVAVARKPTG